MAKVDSSFFAAYLFCLNFLLSDGTFKVGTVWMDKRDFAEPAFWQILRNLTKKMQQDNLQIQLVTSILNQIAQVAKDLQSTFPIWEQTNANILFEFCGTLASHQSSSMDSIYTTMMLIPIVKAAPDVEVKPHYTNWVLQALDQIPDHQDRHVPLFSLVLRLLRALLCCTDWFNKKIAVESLQTIMKQLSLERDVGFTGSSTIYAFILGISQQSWFKDEDVQSLMLSLDLWTWLGAISKDDISVCSDYIRIGRNLANIPHWHSSMQSELSTWWFTTTWGLDEAVLPDFCSTLSDVWGLDPENKLQEPALSSNQKPKDLAATFLCSIWDVFDFTNPHALNQLVLSTIWAAIANDNPANQVTENERAELASMMVDAILHAAKKVSALPALGTANQSGREDYRGEGDFEKLSLILESLARTIKGEIKEYQGDNTWEGVWHQFKVRLIFWNLLPGMGEQLPGELQVTSS
ncbi:hypothetical protein FB45DRAFT_876566 [Roridomyces roridus]|uniref:Uncharacterized protein n=1 Tax=Roridomyces roridus TaxID=1738132 RepID=A0AAD7B441_9AGAR|nr:hypothetical protein FB45DRAFT_876566 [Roridomyces roridus]